MLLLLDFQVKHNDGYPKKISILFKCQFIKKIFQAKHGSTCL